MLRFLARLSITLTVLSCIIVLLGNVLGRFLATILPYEQIAAVEFYAPPLSEISNNALLWIDMRTLQTYRIYKNVHHLFQLSDTPQWSPNGRYLAFVADDKQPPGYSVFLYDSSLHHFYAVVTDLKDVVSLNWSPDSRSILFDDEEFDDKIYLVETVADIDNIRTINTTLANTHAVRWSPVKDEIAFIHMSGDSWDVYLMQSDGSNMRLLTNGHMMIEDFAWSVDGTKLALIAGSDYDLKQNGLEELGITSCNTRCLLQLDLTQMSYPIHLLTDVIWRATSPMWSPNNRQIAFQERASVANQGIPILYNLESNSLHKLWKTPVIQQGYDFQFSWSPAGQWITFASMAGALFKVAADDNHPVQIGDDSIGWHAWRPLPKQ